MKKKENHSAILAKGTDTPTQFPDESFPLDGNNNAISTGEEDDQPEVVIRDATNEFEIECILGSRRFRKGKRFVKKYLTRWVGYGHKFDTWLTRKDLKNAPDLLRDFEGKLCCRKSVRFIPVWGMMAAVLSCLLADRHVPRGLSYLAVPEWWLWQFSSLFIRLRMLKFVTIGVSNSLFLSTFLVDTALFGYP